MCKCISTILVSYGLNAIWSTCMLSLSLFLSVWHLLQLPHSSSPIRHNSIHKTWAGRMTGRSHTTCFYPEMNRSSNQPSADMWTAILHIGKLFQNVCCVNQGNKSRWIGAQGNQPQPLEKVLYRIHMWLLMLEAGHLLRDQDGASGNYFQIIPFRHTWLH